MYLAWLPSVPSLYYLLLQFAHYSRVYVNKLLSLSSKFLMSSQLTWHIPLFGSLLLSHGPSTIFMRAWAQNKAIPAPSQLLSKGQSFSSINLFSGLPLFPSPVCLCWILFRCFVFAIAGLFCCFVGFGSMFWLCLLLVWFSCDALAELGLVNARNNGCIVLRTCRSIALGRAY